MTKRAVDGGGESAPASGRPGRVARATHPRSLRRIARATTATPAATTSASSIRPLRVGPRRAIAISGVLGASLGLVLGVAIARK